MKVIATSFKDKPELKKYMKKLMPFVQLVKVIAQVFNSIKVKSVMSEDVHKVVVISC